MSVVKKILFPTFMNFLSVVLMIFLHMLFLCPLGMMFRAYVFHNFSSRQSSWFFGRFHYVIYEFFVGLFNILFFALVDQDCLHLLAWIFVSIVEDFCVCLHGVAERRGPWCNCLRRCASFIGQVWTRSDTSLVLVFHPSPHSSIILPALQGGVEGSNMTFAYLPPLNTSTCSCKHYYDVTGASFRHTTSDLTTFNGTQTKTLASDWAHLTLSTAAFLQFVFEHLWVFSIIFFSLSHTNTHATAQNDRQRGGIERITLHQVVAVFYLQLPRNFLLIHSKSFPSFN